jgi:endonuclease/exonuclease/phosphatase (EEP) superfamily protein YafD
MLDPAGGSWVRLVAFTPFAVPLYAVATLLLLVAWWRGRGGWRVTARLLVVVSLAGLLLHAHWASGPYVGGSAAQAQTPGRLHVMTSNLRVGRADTSRVVELAVADRVDVLVLEEVTPLALDRLRAAGLSRAMVHTAGRPAAGAAGTMVFSRYPLRHPTRLATGFGSYAVDLRTPTGLVRLLAVHPRPPTGDATAWRSDQGVVRHAAHASHGPTLLVGDLNATMDHLPMRALAGMGYADAATEATSGFQPTWPAAGVVSRFGLGVPSLLPLDHVLLRSGPHGVHTDAVTVEGSDHRALVALVTL